MRRKRWFGYAAWLLLAACLYFFENNTGTRVVLLCSLLFPFIPSLRSAIFPPDAPVKERSAETLTVSLFTRQKSDEPGEIRPYIPGDPIQRIHWKLSAKKDELLVRDTAAGQEITEKTEMCAVPESMRKNRADRHPARVLLVGTASCVLLLFLIPEVRRGVQALCNRLFAASEAVNSYAYRYYPVPENQNVFPAVFLLLCIALLLLALAAVLHSRLMALGIMAACTLFQVYFGLSFPAWINIPLYGLLGLWMLQQPVHRKCMITGCACILLASFLVALFLPGVDPAAETASERLRDRLSRLAEQITGTVPEIPGGEAETRRIHTRSMESGNLESRTEQEFRLVTVEEEQISMPHWVDWMKVILLLLLAVAVVALPFAPFLLLNARKKKAREIRQAFVSEDVSEAVQTIFRQVILWLETTGYDAGNLLFRDWADLLPDDLPEGYPARFARCAADYEEAAYSDHALPEQKRLDALVLLEQTESAMWKAAGWKQRLRLKYWMCLYE